MTKTNKIDPLAKIIEEAGMSLKEAHLEKARHYVNIQNNSAAAMHTNLGEGAWQATLMILMSLYPGQYTYEVVDGSKESDS